MKGRFFSTVVWVMVLSFVLVLSIGVAASARTTITFFGWIEAFHPETWKYMTDLFEAENPDIKIESIGVSYEEAERQMVLMVAGGNAPDFAQLDTIMGFKLAAMDALEPLDEFIAPEVQDDIIPSLLDAAKFHGDFVLLPWSPTPYAFFSNIRLLEKAGYSTHPESIAEFEEMAYKVHEVAPYDEAGNRIWGLSIAGKIDIHTPYLLSPWLYNFGGNWFDEEGKSQIHDETGVELLSWLQKLARDGILGPTPVDREMARMIFARDQKVFIGEGPWQRGLWREQSGLGADFDDHWVVSLYPSMEKGEPGMGIVYEHVLGIFRQSDKKEEAARFLEFLITNDDAIKQYYEVEGMLPATNSQWAKELFQEDYAQTFYQQALAGGYVPLSPHVDMQTTLAAFFCEAYQDIIVNQADVQSTLERVSSLFNTLIEY